METDPMAGRGSSDGDTVATGCPLTAALRVIGGKAGSALA